MIIASLNTWLQQLGEPSSNLEVDSLLLNESTQSQSSTSSQPLHQIPPCLTSDYYVNVFFRDWAPLFRVLDRSKFFTIYADFVADFERISSKHHIAQIYLVYSIAGLSSGCASLEQICSYERQWTDALNALVTGDNVTLLCSLVLAVLFYSIKGDKNELCRYRVMAVQLSGRLGLLQNRNQHLDFLSMDLSKEAFRSLYTLDT